MMLTTGNTMDNGATVLVAEHAPRYDNADNKAMVVLALWSEEFVTWVVDEGGLCAVWGHYFSDLEEALADYHQRLGKKGPSKEAVASAVRTLQAELTANADAIGKILDAETPPVAYEVRDNETLRVVSGRLSYAAAEIVCRNRNTPAMGGLYGVYTLEGVRV